MESKTGPAASDAHSAHVKSRPPQKATDPAKSKPKGCKRHRSPGKSNTRQSQMTDFTTQPTNVTISSESTPLAPPPKTPAQGKTEDGHSKDSPGNEQGTSPTIVMTPLRASTRNVREAKEAPPRVAYQRNSEQPPMVDKYNPVEGFCFCSKAELCSDLVKFLPGREDIDAGGPCALDTLYCTLVEGDGYL